MSVSLSSATLSFPSADWPCRKASLTPGTMGYQVPRLSQALPSRSQSASLPPPPPSKAPATPSDRFVDLQALSRSDSSPKTARTLQPGLPARTGPPKARRDAVETNPFKRTGPPTSRKKPSGADKRQPGTSCQACHQRKIRCDFSAGDVRDGRPACKNCVAKPCDCIPRPDPKRK